MWGHPIGPCSSQLPNSRLQTDVAPVNISPCLGTLSVPGFAWRFLVGRECLGEGHAAEAQAVGQAGSRFDLATIVVGQHQIADRRRELRW